MGIGTVQHGVYGSLMNVLGACIGACGAFPCLPCPNPFREVQQGAFESRAGPLMSTFLIKPLASTGSVGLVSRFGQFYKAVDPGLAQINVCTESLKIVDVKVQIAPIGRQTVITRDNVNVSSISMHSVGYFY